MNISRYRLRQFVKHLSCDMPLIAASVNWRCSFKSERNKKKEEEECCITFFFFLFALYARAWKWIIAADYMRASITLRALISSTGAAADVLLRPFYFSHRLLYGYQTRTLAAASFQIGFFFLCWNVSNHCGSIAPDHRTPDLMQSHRSSKKIKNFKLN